MELSDQLLEQVLTYLSEKMSPDAKLEFEKRLSSDPELKAEVERYRDPVLAVNAYTRTRLRSEVGNLLEEVRPVESSSTSRRWMRIAAVMLLLLMGMSAFVVLRNSYSSGSLYQQNFEAYPDRFSTMGNNGPKEAFRNGLNSYNAEDWESAIGAFAKIPEQDPNYLHANFYAGISRLQLDKSDQAISILSEILLESDYYDEPAAWYLALAYLQDNQDEQAAELLESIVADADHYKKDEAAKILKKLDSPWKKLF